MAAKMQKSNTATTEVAKSEPRVRTTSYVLCHSIIPGSLFIIGMSGALYTFVDYGAECEIEYNDLINLVRMRSDHIYLPRIVIDDEAFVEEFPQLKDVYAKAYDHESLLEILSLPVPQMKAEIEKLPDSANQSMKILIATEISNGHIDSISKIRALSQVYDSDFNLISELFGN